MNKLVFAETAPIQVRQEAWKILIVDDEEEIHNITTLVLRHFVFENKLLQFFHAHSSEQGMQLLVEHPDIAVALIDVVMETDDAGLQLVKFIRETQKNGLIQIILRTGQPGIAPQKDVLIHYEINDYKEKTELTAQKLYATIISALRSYRNLKTIEENRDGLQKMISASGVLFSAQSMAEFIPEVLTQLNFILHLESNLVYCQSCLTLNNELDEPVVLAGTGAYAHSEQRLVKDILPEHVYRDIQQANAQKMSLYQNDCCIIYFPHKKGDHANLLYLEGLNALNAVDRQLLQVFCAQTSIAIDNISLKQKLLGEIEKREHTLKILKEAQDQLLQSEKMACLGQLAAGVAHEINNPIGYVASNIIRLEEYISELIALLNEYELTEQFHSLENNASVSKIKEQIDIEFVKEDMLDLVNESKEGIDRLQTIVRSLKDFSRMDVNDSWQFANLHKGIDSTLNIVSNEIKYKAKVEKEYAELPEVECIASRLNQVFMNLLVNAAHAIDGFGTIWIRTGHGGDQVWVEVEDSGKGISEENLKRIFEPFFTTKPKGVGTGLGLSLSYGIIQEHGGQIEVRSELGKGTCFRLSIPVRHIPKTRNPDQP